ncbi:MAG: hypothetical protein E7484_01895 [Ruminococcaceae bacterium]|nr:hypothetical protein [Oscillospiraceae bacterium]
MAAVHKAMPLGAVTTGEGSCGCVTVDVVEENNLSPVQSGAVYAHVAAQVGNIEILLETI